MAEAAKLLTVKDIAEYLGFSQMTIRRWVKDKKIPHLKAGRNIRFKYETISNWMEAK